MAASPTKKESTKPPPPVIGRAGRYTVFITPPSKPTKSSSVSLDSLSTTPPPPPPVRPPPQQFDKLPSSRSPGLGFGFFRDAIAKVQDVHSSVDGFLAEWLGLNQSKYQWALNDYYESKGIEKEASKTANLTSKGNNV